MNTQKSMVDELKAKHQAAVAAVEAFDKQTAVRQIRRAKLLDKAVRLRDRIYGKRSN